MTSYQRIPEIHGARINHSINLGAGLHFITASGIWSLSKLDKQKPKYIKTKT